MLYLIYAAIAVVRDFYFSFSFALTFHAVINHFRNESLMVTRFGAHCLDGNGSPSNRTKLKKGGLIALWFVNI